MSFATRPASRRLLVAFLTITAIGFALSGCGGTTKSVPPADQQAIDSFTDSARRWTVQGADPWYAAFKSSNPVRLAAVSPKAEGAMAAAVSTMQKSAEGIATPEVRAPFEKLVASYRLKLAAVKQIDQASQAGSISGVRIGVTQLQQAGVSAAKAFKAYAVAAKKKWGSDPLSEFKIG